MAVVGLLTNSYYCLLLFCIIWIQRTLFIIGYVDRAVEFQKNAIFNMQLGDTDE